MTNIEVKSDSINAMVRELKFRIMDLVYGTNDAAEDDESDMEIIADINSRINDIMTEISCIESARDREHTMASRLRKMVGNDLIAECDAAGIE